MTPDKVVDFRSDNVAPVASEVLCDLNAVARVDTASPYGDDDITVGLGALVSDVFGQTAVAWPVPTGTAANAVTITGLLPKGGVVVCHERAHAFRSEEGATVHANPQVRFEALPGDHGRLDPTKCEAALREISGPKLLTVTQANEYGRAYDLQTLSALADVARRTGARLHLDGARLAPACCATGASPREVIAALRPDSLSLGLTKVGAMSTDVAIFFQLKLPDDWRATMRRLGLLSSKMRYQSTQIHTLLKNGLWLNLARHSVEMSRYLRRGLESAPGVVGILPNESNLLLVEFTESVRSAFACSPFLVKQWLDPHLTRLVTSHATTADEADKLIAWLRTL
jgi:threonine aldolase